MFGKLFGKGPRHGKGGEPASPSVPSLPANLSDLKEKAYHHTQALMSAHEGGWRISECANWDVDLATGTISFFFADGKIVRAPAELISTWNSADETWLWGWDHPSAPPGSAVAAAKVKAHADAHDLTELQNAKVACEFDEGWQLAAIAVLAGNLQGVYRGKASDTAWAYIGFGNVTISKA